jgi:hypothetical protein
MWAKLENFLRRLFQDDDVLLRNHRSFSKVVGWAERSEAQHDNVLLFEGRLSLRSAKLTIQLLATTCRRTRHCRLR